MAKQEYRSIDTYPLADQITHWEHEAVYAWDEEDRVYARRKLDEVLAKRDAAARHD